MASEVRTHSLTGPTLNEVREAFERLDPSLVEQIVLMMYGQKSKMYSKDQKAMINLLMQGVIHICVSLLVGSISPTDFPSFAETLELSSLGQSQETLREMKAKILSMGVGEFFETKLDSSKLEYLHSLFKLPETKDIQRIQIVDELLLRGVQRTLDFLSVPLLKEIASDSKFKGPKSILVDRILQIFFQLRPLTEEEGTPTTKKRKRGQSGEATQAQTPQPPTKSRRRQSKASDSEDGSEEEEGREVGVLPDGTIPGTEVWTLDRLVPGLNQTTIFTHYNMIDLKAFCKKHSIAPTGKKSAVIKRILQYFDSQEKGKS